MLDARKLVRRPELTPADTTRALVDKSGMSAAFADARFLCGPVLRGSVVAFQAPCVERHAPATTPNAVMSFDQPGEVRPCGFVQGFDAEAGHSATLAAWSERCVRTRTPLSPDSARCDLRQIHPVDNLEVFRVQLEVEDIEVGGDAFLVHRLRNDDQPLLKVPTDDRLRHGLSMFLAMPSMVGSFNRRPLPSGLQLSIWMLCFS